MSDSLLVRIKILPRDIDVKIAEMANMIKKNLEEGMIVKREIEEPIAFGLIALIADIQILNKEGEVSKLEEIIKSVDYVGQMEVLGVSIQSTRLKI
jgi:elongation factor 1-beta